MAMAMGRETIHPTLGVHYLGHLHIARTGTAVYTQLQAWLGAAFSHGEKSQCDGLWFNAAAGYSSLMRLLFTVSRPAISSLIKGYMIPALQSTVSHQRSSSRVSSRHGFLPPGVSQLSGTCLRCWRRVVLRLPAVEVLLGFLDLLLEMLELLLVILQNLQYMLALLST